MSESARQLSGAPTGLLLINLGTPDAPTPAAVRAYLREFLSDPLVLDMPGWRRWLILNLFILPSRPKVSAEAYAKIWTERGSPLLFHGRDLAVAVQERFGPSVVVDLAMRYGHPSIPEVLDRLRGRGIKRIVAFPLYPQYSAAATGSSVEEVRRCAGRGDAALIVQVVPPFYDHPAYIDAYARQAGPVLEELKPERVLLSFHGLPERQITKGATSGAHCLKGAGCCDRIGEINENCYRAHSFATARLLGDRLRLTEQSRIVCFQSRLGRAAWLGPFTAEVVIELAREGVKRVAVLSPAFVADCLETVEEIGIRAASSFREYGGEILRLVPGLNATPAWADAVVRIAREASPWLRGAVPDCALAAGGGPAGA